MKAAARIQTMLSMTASTQPKAASGSKGGSLACGASCGLSCCGSMSEPIREHLFVGVDAILFPVRPRDPPKRKASAGRVDERRPSLRGAKRRSNPEPSVRDSGLLRFARNDVDIDPISIHPASDPIREHVPVMPVPIAAEHLGRV